jgi:hypothetical protein
MPKTQRIEGGPGLKVLNRKERWYGGGYCGICGSREVVPTAVRYWDCDDGWLMGVLCEYCLDDARERGPQPDDYAYRPPADELTHADKIDILAELGDLDNAYSETSME